MWVSRPVIELELSEPLPDARFEGCRAVQALLTWNGVPCGWHEIPVAGDRLAGSLVLEALAAAHLDSIAARLLREHLLQGRLPDVETFYATAPLRSEPATLAAGPSVSVVLCTRNRPDDLRECVESLCNLEPPPLEILVIDNAPPDDRSRQVVARLPRLRYIVEPRPGLSWARNRGIVESAGEVIAFVDDDVRVDQLWVGRLQQTFTENPTVGAVTGLVSPGELETLAQAQFEVIGGFSRGYSPKWLHPARGRRRLHWKACETGRYGTGANMAFRRAVFVQVGLFAPELGAGTRTEGGEDLEMLYRLIKQGIPVAYEPRALAWHRHRRESEALVRQMHGWGVGSLAFMSHAKRLFPEEVSNLRRFELYWLWMLFRRVVGGVIVPGRVPARLQREELAGAIVGRRRYREARAIARAIETTAGPLEASGFPAAPGTHAETSEGEAGTAVRAIDLATGVPALDGLAPYDRVRVSVSANGRHLADVEIENHGLDISRDRLINAILAHRPAADWLALAHGVPGAQVRTALRDGFFERCLPGVDRQVEERLPRTIPISIVLVARRTTADVRRQLAALAAAAEGRPFEVIVLPIASAVDAATLEAEFPAIRWQRTGEPGLSTALNAAARIAAHEILVCTTDDVVPAAGWLEQLLAPFSRNDIDAVCGRVLPSRQPDAVHARGAFADTPVELGALWFHSRRLGPLPIQVWGTTANLAFRRQVLADPAVEGFEPALGAGVPSGDGETAYFFYRLLRHGYRIRYQPDAITWFQGEGTIRELVRRHFDVGKGYVASYLHMLLRDHDFRAVGRLAVLPGLHLSRATKLLASHDDAIPGRAILAELVGNLLGPFALWRSYRRVKTVKAAATS